MAVKGTSNLAIQATGMYSPSARSGRAITSTAMTFNAFRQSDFSPLSSRTETMA